MSDPLLDPWLAKLAAALPADVQQRLTHTEAQLTVARRPLTVAMPAAR